MAVDSRTRTVDLLTVTTSIASVANNLKGTQ
jgi:hypothetical protein